MKIIRLFRNIEIIYLLLFFPGFVLAESYPEEFYFAITNQNLELPMEKKIGHRLEMSYDGTFRVSSSAFQEHPWEEEKSLCAAQAGDWFFVMSKEDRLSLQKDFFSAETMRKDKIKEGWKVDLSRTGQVDQIYWPRWPLFLINYWNNNIANFKPYSVLTMSGKKSSNQELQIIFRWSGLHEVILHLPSYPQTAFSYGDRKLKYLRPQEKMVILGPKMKQFTLRLGFVKPLSKEEKSLKEEFRYENNYSLRYLRNASNPTAPKHQKLNLCAIF